MIDYLHEETEDYDNDASMPEEERQYKEMPIDTGVAAWPLLAVGVLTGKTAKDGKGRKESARQ
jgi:hypothetical protein